MSTVRTQILQAIADVNLLEETPTILEFPTFWNEDVSVMCSHGTTKKGGQKVVRRDKSLRSIVLSLFHDRRGKIAKAAGILWRSVFNPATGCVVEFRSGVQAELTTSSSDCWSFMHERDHVRVFRVLKRNFDKDARSGTPDAESPLWKVHLKVIDDATYRVSCAGLPAVTALPLMADDPDEAAPDPPYANIEWTIHPGCLPYFSAVLASAVICKTPGLIIDLEHEPKSRRLISIATNASDPNWRRLYFPL